MGAKNNVALAVELSISAHILFTFEYKHIKQHIEIFRFFSL